MARIGMHSLACRRMHAMSRFYMLSPACRRMQSLACRRLRLTLHVSLACRRLRLHVFNGLAQYAFTGL